MYFDIFFSICQTPVDGYTPTETKMFESFFEQVKAADQLGYGVAWVAESHFSTQTQKNHRSPVVPHWQGEVGLNCDIFQMGQKILASTSQIEVGSAVLNLFCQGGPISVAEKVAFYSKINSFGDSSPRRLHLGFSSGRFDFMARTMGIAPTTELEKQFWRVYKHKIFSEACEVFLRLYQGETLSSDQVPVRRVGKSDFLDANEFERFKHAAGFGDDSLNVQKRYLFEPTKIIPQDINRDSVQLILGSHDPNLQKEVNTFAPVQVFNLSITDPKVVEETHVRMQSHYYGGGWQRQFMPRTVMVFLNDEKNLSEAEKTKKAHASAEKSLGAYWRALEGTIDKRKIEQATNNAVVGGPETVLQQIKERFHPEDRLMLWFDFFNHDTANIVRMMQSFKEKIAINLQS